MKKYAELLGRKAFPDLLEHLEYYYSHPAFSIRKIDREVFMTLKGLGKSLWREIEKELWKIYDRDIKLRFRHDVMKCLEELNVKPWKKVAKDIHWHFSYWEIDYRLNGFLQSPDTESLRYVAEKDTNLACEFILPVLSSDDWSEDDKRDWLRQIKVEIPIFLVKEYLNDKDEELREGASIYTRYFKS